jgi:hypothetical protein
LYFEHLFQQILQPQGQLYEGNKRFVDVLEDFFGEAGVVHQHLAQKHQVLEVYLVVRLLLGLREQCQQVGLECQADDFGLVSGDHVLEGFGDVDFKVDMDFVADQ